MYERNGLISSREFPSRITYGDCLWDIHPKNKSVLIHFGHLHLPESDGCRYDGTVIVIYVQTFSMTLYIRAPEHLSWLCYDFMSEFFPFNQVDDTLFHLIIYENES